MSTRGASVTQGRINGVGYTKTPISMLCGSGSRGAVALESVVGLTVVLLFGLAAAQALMLAHAQVRTHAAAAAAVRAAAALADHDTAMRANLMRNVVDAAVSELVPASPRGAFWHSRHTAGVLTDVWERMVWAAHATQVSLCFEPAEAAEVARIRIAVDFAAPIVMPGMALVFAEAPPPWRSVVQPGFSASLGMPESVWHQASAALASAWPQLAVAQVGARRALAWPQHRLDGLRAC